MNIFYCSVPLGKVMLSESESDSDILFESRKPSKLLNGDSRNGVKTSRNNFKLERRVKTWSVSVILTLCLVSRISGHWSGTSFLLSPSHLLFIPILVSRLNTTYFIVFCQRLLIAYEDFYNFSLVIQIYLNCVINIIFTLCFHSFIQWETHIFKKY